MTLSIDISRSPAPANCLREISKINKINKSLYHEIVPSKCRPNMVNPGCRNGPNQQNLMLI